MAEKNLKGIKRFKLLAASGSYLSKAYRVALAPVLTATRPEVSERAPDDHRGRILDDAAHLMRLWRRRVNLLASHGLPALQDTKGYVQAANCPPVGVVTNHQRLWCCRNRLICPWCWCRQHVRENYWRFAKALYANQETDVPLPYSLVLVRTDRHYPVSNGAWSAKQAIESAVRGSKGLYYRQVMQSALGGSVLCSVEPPRPGVANPCWTVLHRVLAVVRGDDTNDYYLEPDLGQHPADYGAWATRAVEHIPFPRRAALAGAIGKFAEYPSLMLTGGLKSTIAVCDAYAPVVSRTSGGKIKKKGGVRLSAIYGILRGKLQIPCEDHDQIPLKSMESTYDLSTEKSVG